jgi:hypothetical protein
VQPIRSRSPRRLSVLAALLAVALVAAIAPAGASAAIDPGTYKISTAASGFGKVLDVAGASTANGAPVIQFAHHGGPNQQWIVVQSGSTQFGTPAYSLKPVHAQSKCLDIAGASEAFGAHAIVFDCHFGLNQQFFISPQSGEMRIVPRHDGLTLTVLSSQDGAQLQQQLGPVPPAPLPAGQKFRFQRIG